jgi:hypothetical protein
MTPIHFVPRVEIQVCLPTKDIRQYISIAVHLLWAQFQKNMQCMLHRALNTIPLIRSQFRRTINYTESEGKYSDKKRKETQKRQYQ